MAGNPYHQYQSGRAPRPFREHLGFLARKLAGRHWTSRFVKGCSRFLFENDYPAQAQVRLLIYHHFSDICWSLVYPFFHYAERFQQVYGLDTRLRPIESFFEDENDDVDADIVMIQPWISEPAEKLAAAFARYRGRHPLAKIVFLDSYANTDMRFGEAVGPHIDLYLRKAIFRDQSQFLRPFAGDTNLTEYYSALYGIEAEPVDWHTPKPLLDRLGLLPNFLTAPRFIEGFLGRAPDFERERPIDLHSRIEVKGSPWYAAMRAQALDSARSIDGIRLTPAERIDRRQFMDELRQSKLCWSPFGYGELCWRDLEAVMAGAVLVKPDMSHVATSPDLYHAGETYLPVKWDFSDLEEVVSNALADPARRARIAANAWAIARDYLASERFVTDMGQALALRPLGQVAKRSKGIVRGGIPLPS